MFLTFRYAFFDTKLILSQHPQQVFYNFKNPFLKIFGKSIIFLIFWMFLHHPSKFGEFSLKIGGEIICQSWPLLTPFFNFRIVHWYWTVFVVRPNNAKKKKNKNNFPSSRLDHMCTGGEISSDLYSTKKWSQNEIRVIHWAQWVFWIDLVSQLMKWTMVALIWTCPNV